MEPLFDIFRGTTDKDAMWVEAVFDLPAARERMEQLAGNAPGPYFVFAQTSRLIIARINTLKKLERPARHARLIGAA